METPNLKSGNGLSVDSRNAQELCSSPMAYQSEVEKLTARWNENPGQYFAPLADAYRKAGDLEMALEVLGLPASDTVIVGDRIETDVTMGKALGLGTVLVLSGVTAGDDRRIAELKPDYVLASIRDLLSPEGAPTL